VTDILYSNKKKEKGKTGQTSRERQREIIEKKVYEQGDLKPDVNPKYYI
jgi:hypothetical protein